MKHDDTKCFTNRLLFIRFAIMQNDVISSDF